MNSLLLDIELALFLPSANRHNVAIEYYSDFIQAAINRFLIQDLTSEENKETYDAGYISITFYDELIADLNSDYQTGAEEATLYDETVIYSEGQHVWKSDNKLYKCQSDDFVEVTKFNDNMFCELWHGGGLSKMLGWMVWAMAAPHVAYKQGNNGITRIKTENVEGVSMKEVAALNSSQVGMIDTLRTPLHRYLIANKDDFETYYNDHEAKTISTSSARRSAGFAVYD